MFPFRNPRSAAVVTGAAGGIGAATAIELARRGSALALVDRDSAGLETTAAAARRFGVTVSAHPTDLADDDATAALPSAVVAEHGGAHILVNCAGVSLMGSFSQVSLEEFQWLLRINLWGTISTTKAFLPLLLEQPAAHISNLSSGYGYLAPAGRVPYATSKFAVRGFTEAIRHELQGGPVSVSVVHPGGIKTSIAMNARVAAAVPKDVAQRASEAQTAAYRTTPEDAAAAIVRGIEKRRPRVLIGGDARLLDALVRITPSHYWRFVRGTLSAATRT